MECDEDMEDLIVILDVDKNKYSDEEYELLEDLITIEDEGIMDISHKLQQRDFDEYIRSIQKDTTILPQSFCRIRKNIKLLDSCRPLSIQVVDCKKFQVFFNEKLAVDLKTRENLSEKFKEILSDKISDISDDDSLEIDVKIADNAEMEDLIRLDYVPENHLDDHDLSLTQKVEVDVENMNATKSFDKGNNFYINLNTTEANVSNPIDNYSIHKSNFKSGISSHVLNACENDCITISTQQKSSTCKGNKRIPHYHPVENQLSASKFNVTSKVKNNISNTNEINNITLQTFDIITNDSFLVDTQRIVNKIKSVDFSKGLIKKISKTNKEHSISKTSRPTKKKERLLDKSKNTAKKTNKNKNKHTQSIQLNIEMQKKIEDMLVKVKELKDTYSKKASKKQSDVLNDPKVLNYTYECVAQVNNTNNIANYTRFFQWHQNNFSNRWPVSNWDFNNSALYDTIPVNLINVPIQQPYYDYNINTPFMVSPMQFSYKSNNNQYFNNHDFHNFPNQNTEKSMLSKNPVSINFMKPHLQKLAKANENPNSIKKRPIHNYGLSNSQQGNGKKCTNTTTLQNKKQNRQDDIVYSKKYILKETSDESNLKTQNNTIFGDKYRTVVKNLQNRVPVIKKNTPGNNIPVRKIRVNLEQTIVQGSKDSVVSCFNNRKETHELQQDIFLPQQIPTVQNSQIIEPVKQFLKPERDITEHQNHGKKIQNVTEPLRIPLLMKKCTKIHKVIANQSATPNNEEDNRRSSPKQAEYNSHEDTHKITKKSINAGDTKKETTEVDHIKLMSSSIKVPEKDQRPVECIQTKTQSVPKIAKKPTIKDEVKIEIKQKEVGYVKPTPSIRSAPKSTMEQNTLQSVKVGESEKPNLANGMSPALTKAIKKLYSPPVLPIPSFKKTFEVLAKMKLISKYRYRRDRNKFQYEMIDHDKILLNRRITKDLQEYA